MMQFNFIKSKKIVGCTRGKPSCLSHVVDTMCHQFTFQSLECALLVHSDINRAQSKCNPKKWLTLPYVRL